MELIKTSKDEHGNVQETYKLNHKNINEVTFTYTGAEENLDDFLKFLILGYARKNKIIA